MKSEHHEAEVLDAVEIAARVNAGSLSASKSMDDCERRAKAMEPLIHAFSTLDFRRARERTPAMPRGPLAGVPIAIKDLVAVPGLPHHMGSRMFAGNIASEPAPPLIERLEAAGAVIVGKTTTSEFGLLGSTETLLDGVTHNPWDLSRSAAGSSGGSAAAVAAGIVPLAHASDGGGSIRIPASVTGLFGFKPSRGRVVSAQLARSPMDGLMSELCVSRGVLDTALFLSVVEDRNADPEGPVGLVREPIERRLRIATWSTTLLGAEPTPAVRNSLERARTSCRELGHEVVERPAPELDGAQVRDAFFVLAGHVLSGLFAMMESTLGRPLGEDDAEPFTRELVRWAEERGPSAGPEAFAWIDQLSRDYLEVFDDADVVLTPTLAREPWPLGWLSPALGRAELVARTERAVGYTPIHNMAGVPSMSVPLHWSDDGLPVGSCFAAPRGADATLLSLALELESAFPWQSRWAPWSYPALFGK